MNYKFHIRKTEIEIHFVVGILTVSVSREVTTTKVPLVNELFPMKGNIGSDFTLSLEHNFDSILIMAKRIRELIGKK